VHREDALLGHVIVHGVEDALLHLARVLGADDDDGRASRDWAMMHRGLVAQLGLLLGGEAACLPALMMVQSFLKGTGVPAALLTPA
jgi:hypothetical protein